MNPNSCEIRRLNFRSFFNRCCLWRCCLCCSNCFCCLDSERLPTLFVPLSSLCLGICLPCTRFSSHFSAVHSVVTVCAARDIRLLFKLLLKFRTVLNIAMAEEPLLGIKVSTKTIPTVLRFSFTLKRNET